MANHMTALLADLGAKYPNAAHEELVRRLLGLLEVCELIRDDLGIRRDFAPCGTLNFATQLLNAIDRAKGET